MIAIGEDAAGASEHTIQSARDADRQALKAARESTLVVGLGEQVDVISLHREVHETKSESILALRERVADGAHRALCAEARKTAPAAQRDVDRMGSRQRGAGDVRRGAPAACGLSACVLAATAPRAEGELELTGHDLDSALI